MSSAAHFALLPKVELHLHLEGSIGPALLARISGRRPAALRPLYRFAGFPEFLKAYGRICGLLRRPLDLEMAVRDLGRRLRRQRVLHAEVFFSPAVHARNGIGYAETVVALESGAAQVESGGGPSLLFIADGVRQWGPGVFREMLAAMRQRPSPRVVAVGLGGDERAMAARRFEASFRMARQLGLAAVVHAGEVGSPASLAAAIDRLQPTRIAHGIRAVEAPALVRRLQRLGLPLDVCITSNRRTGAVEPGAGHPLATLVRAGVRVTLGTDDPALFRVSLSGEYARAARLGIRRRQLGRMAVDAARASLLPTRRKRELVSRMKAAWEAPGLPRRTSDRLERRETE